MLFSGYIQIKCSLDNEMTRIFKFFGGPKKGVDPSNDVLVKSDYGTVTI